MGKQQNIKQRNLTPETRYDRKREMVQINGFSPWYSPGISLFTLDYHLINAIKISLIKIEIRSNIEQKSYFSTNALFTGKNFMKAL